MVTNSDRSADFAADVFSAWKVATRLQLEGFALLARRQRAYLELPQTLAACHSSEDLAAGQRRFIETAQRQYLATLELALSALPLPQANEPTSHRSSARAPKPAARNSRLPDVITIAEEPSRDKTLRRPVQSDHRAK